MSWSWKNKDARMIDVLKCILGMANLPDGGYIVFGVKQQDNDFIPNGMDPEHFMSFNQDKVDDVVKNYAEPFVEVKVTKVSRDVVNNKAISEGINEFPDDGGDFIVIEVGEFKELPVICKNNCKLHGMIELREGAMYTRSMGKAETTEFSAQAVMREIIELAADKSIRRLIERMGRAGILRLISPELSDEERFRKQEEEMK